MPATHLHHAIAAHREKAKLEPRLLGESTPPTHVSGEVTYGVRLFRPNNHRNEKLVHC